MALANNRVRSVNFADSCAHLHIFCVCAVNVMVMVVEAMVAMAAIVMVMVMTVARHNERILCSDDHCGQLNWANGLLVMDAKFISIELCLRIFLLHRLFTTQQFVRHAFFQSLFYGARTNAKLRQKLQMKPNGQLTIEIRHFLATTIQLSFCCCFGFFCF